MPHTTDVLAFWGKARPTIDAVVPSHPVAYHLLDVAAVADALLAARPLARERAARLLQLAPDQAHRFLVALTALHDLGKFTPAFQAKAPALWPAVLGPLDLERVGNTRHTDDGYILWFQNLASVIGPRLWPGAEDVLDVLAQAVFGHHGRPIMSGVLRERLAEDVFGAGQAAAIACGDALVALLHPVPIDAPPPPLDRVKAASWWIAGLVTVADWIGSRAQWFPYTEPDTADPELRSYWAHARTQAAKAIREEGLEPPRPAPLGTFEQLTRITIPSPAQSWASSVELPAGPLLIVIEDVTGAGKTEAAQMLVHRLMADGRATGAYWAMPTQATANAMYLRQAKAIDRMFVGDERRPSLALAHGQARLHDGFRAAVLPPAVSEIEADGRGTLDDAELPGGIACAAFFADDRRAALIADVGAGTVDQAILGVLPTKFNTVRLFGLADKVLVLDEVHAYDAYVGVEVRELLRFQAALGGCAVLLSATLSREQREQLVRAWREGIDLGRRRPPRLFEDDASAHLVHEMAYPLATVVAPRELGVRETPLGAAPWSCRAVGVRFVRDEQAALNHVAATAAQGAAVAWVRNTVDDCLRAAAALRERGIAPIVFHARFAQGDRQAREREVLQLFGKAASEAERSGRVLVATQVIEQSLDLDFDVLVSDLAPVDLLIQRAGRLQRHPARNASRPAGLEREIVVLAPAADPEPASNWLTALLPGTAAVYEDAGVLWRTARVLESVRAIETPGGVRNLIESVYGSREVPAALERVAQRAEGKARGDTSAADYVALKVADGYDGNARGWVDDVRAPTRVGDPQTTIRLARVAPTGALEPWVSTEGPPWKAWALSEVRVYATRVSPGALAEPQYRARVDAVRAEWGRFERDIPILPLTEVEPGVWRGALVDPRRDRSTVIRYTVGEGLAVEPPA